MDKKGIVLAGQMEKSNLLGDLALLEPGHLQTDVFEAVARLVVTPTFVVVPLFKRGGNTHVYLTRRDSDDAHYAGLLHPPGKVILSSDDSLDAVFERLVLSELNNLMWVEPPIFVAPFFDQISRGRELSLIYFCEIDDPGDEYETFDCSSLPVDVIANDIPRIQCAVEAFETYPRRSWK